MNIKMISPRTIFNRKPFGRQVLHLKDALKENNPDFKNKMEICDEKDNDDNDFWIVRTVANQQLELYVKGCGVVLHKFTSQDNNHMFTGYTDTPIKCATFACLSQKVSTNATIESIFQEIHNSRPMGIMIFTDTIAKYYGFNAEIHTCKLPCQVSSGWTFRNCIFVEREDLPVMSDYSPHSLFLMSHTLAEFTPVVYKDEFGHCGFVNETRFRIIALCETSFLLLAYDVIDESFSVWRIRDCVREDFSSLYDTHWDGSITIKREKLQSNSFSAKSSDTNNRTNNHHDRSHFSSEYFEVSDDNVQQNRSIDDLDIRSPLARSLKIIKDTHIPDKMTLLNEVSSAANRSNVSVLRRKMVEPLYPKVCLDYLFKFKTTVSDIFFDSKQMIGHSTPVSNESRRKNLVDIDGKKSRKTVGFFAEDFFCRKYLCCMKPMEKHQILQIVKFNYENSTFSHLDEQSYQVLDAVYLDRLKLIIMLEMSSTLSIYTGNSFVCKISLLTSLVYEPEMFEEVGIEMPTNEINSMVRLSEPTDYGLTIHTASASSYRLYLPDMVRFHLVKKCLLVLKKLLPINVGMTFLCRWYSLNRAVDNNEATSAEWRRFVEFLLENLGFIKQSHNDNSIVRDVKELCLNQIGDKVNDSSSSSGGCDVSMEEICTKKIRTNAGLYSIENRCINRDRLEDFSHLAHNVSDRLLSRYAPIVLYSLHLVYESEKFNYSSCLYLDNLAALNCSVACSVEAVRYIDYYVRDNPDLWARVNRLPSLVPHISPVENETIWTSHPPDWNKLFLDILLDKPTDKYPIIEDLSEMALQLIKIWLVMFRHENLASDAQLELNRHLYRINFNMAGKPCQYGLHVPDDLTNCLANGILTIANRFERTACYLGEINFHSTDIDYVNSGMAAIFKIVFFHCNKYPHLYSILRRSDLDKQRQLILPIVRESSVLDVLTNPIQKFRSLSESRRNCYSYWTNNVKPMRSLRKMNDDVRKFDSHHLLAVLDCDPIVQLAFPDVRIHEAYKMLQSCTPIELDVTICNNLTADKGDVLSNALKEELDGHLKIINCQRTFALPIGRGMLGLQIVQSNWTGEKLHVPALCLTGKFSLSESGKPQSIENSSSAKQWPNFHNGVAAGLTISPMNDAVDFVWILKQCPSMNIDKIELSAEQAGILLGLGLNGHLNKLNPDTIGQTIKSMNEMATMAILIGLSAFNLGSKNSVLSKHIFFHYRRLIPGEKDQNDPISTLCQVSAIISAGLLNFKSGDRKMARIFIEEMGRSREHLSVDGSPPVDIELTSVCAGFSVGLIMFQQGDVFCREYNSDELTRLMSYLKGTYRFQPKDTNGSEVPTDSHIRMILKNHDLKKPQPISEVDNWNTFQTKNPRVQEGEYYNIDITGSGAAVALGMIFMDSSNEIIARQLECPETFYLLEQIRSPVLCFRQIAHGLIMWKKVRPNKLWVESTIPDFVSSKAFVNKPTGISDKYLETANESYLQMLVGSCFVMGLRYAGTDDDNARQTIIGYVEHLLDIRNDEELVQNINRNQYDWAVSTLFLSACMVSAGSGDLQLLKMSRYLRSIHHPKDCVNYGVNMTFSMSIGLLFLGGGKLTLSNSPRCAAILLIAFFPRFPPTYSGRRYHLQSLRHIYVIATRPRVMCAVDLDTQTALPIDSKIKFKNGHVREYHGCFVYPPDNPSLISEIELYDKEGIYWPQIYKPRSESWNILQQSLQSGGYVFVKKKSSEIELKELVAKFRVEKLLHGYQICDYRLLVNFVDRTHDPAMFLSTINTFNTISIHDRVLDFITTHKSDLKIFIMKLLDLDLFNFEQFVSFLKWSQDSGLMRVWSVFASYLELSLYSMKQIQCSDADKCFLSEESKFIIKEILK